MAFVFRSERRIQLSSNEEGDVGPGQYLSQDVIKPTKTKSKAPFNINTFRENKLKKDDIPGPGSYDYDDKYEKIAKIIAKQKEREKSEPLYKSIEYNFNNNGPYSLLLTSEKKNPGFGSKEKRFKNDLQRSEVPGPGQYKIDNEYLIKPSNTLNLVPKNSPKKITGSPKRIVAIPSKNQSYGYNISERGEILMNEDPDKSFRYKGEKDDSVGPGYYNLDKPWIKNSIDWSKTSINRNISNDNLQSSTMVNSYDIHTLENQSEGVSINSKIKKTLDKINLKNSKEKIFKQISNKRKSLLSLKNNKTDEDMLVDKFIFKDTPGPGYYYEERDKVKANNKPEKFQVFGSSSPRFQINSLNQDNNVEVGPGYYYKDDTKFTKMKIQEIRDKMGFNMGRKRDSGSLEKNKIEKEILSSNLGPGAYNPDLPGKKILTNIANFGSLERRFVEKTTEKEKSPGPGSYLNHAKWVKEDQQKLKEEPVRKYDAKPSSNPVLKEKEVFENPPVGSYNSDVIFSLGYKISQKTNQYQSAIAPFASMQKRFGENKQNDNIGPGQYYKEKKIEHTQSLPPFRTGEQRNNNQQNSINPGPGDYNKSSYFDWNKKSFNILYL